MCAMRNKEQKEFHRCKHACACWLLRTKKEILAAGMLLCGFGSVIASIANMMHTRCIVT